MPDQYSLTMPGTVYSGRGALDKIREIIGADKLHYLSEEGLAKAIKEIPKEDMCMACFNGRYPEALHGWGLDKETGELVNE